jgi:hypothetical protein
MTITAERIQTYATDPMAFFADVSIPTAGGSSRLGDVWATFQQEAFRELGACLQAVANRQRPPRRGIWIERTKGGSKDTDVGIGLLWLLMFSHWPQLVELAADDFDQITETRLAMQEVVRLNPWMAERVTIQTKKVICEATASECVFLTRDALGSHGSRPSVTVCNELSHCQSEDFISTVMDNADKMPNNLAIIATNAGHLDTWQYRWRENYRPDPTWYFQKVTEPGPWIDPAKVADAKRRNSPSRFARLWQGVWCSGGGDALEADDIQAAITMPGPLMKRLPLQRAVITLDLGIKHDRSAMTVLLGDWEVSPPRIKLAWVEQWQPTAGVPVDLERIFQAICWARDTYQANVICYDEWQAVSLVQRAQRLGLSPVPVQFGGNGATEMANALLEVFRGRFIDIFRHEQLLKDLAQLSIVERPSGGYKLTAPRGSDGHADIAISMALGLPLCWQAIREGVVDYGGASQQT